MLWVAIVCGHRGVWLVLRDAVEVDDAVAQMDVIAGEADGPLDQEEVGWSGWACRRR